MITGEIFPPIAVDNFSSGFFDALEAEHSRDCDSSEQEDELGIEKIDLLEEVQRGAGLNFVGFWRAVRRRTALDDICDEEILALERGALEDMLEITASVAYERPAGLVFLFTGSFTDDHHL